MGCEPFSWRATDAVIIGTRSHLHVVLRRRYHDLARDLFAFGGAHREMGFAFQHAENEAALLVGCHTRARLLQRDRRVRDTFVLVLAGVHATADANAFSSWVIQVGAEDAHATG